MALDVRAEKPADVPPSLSAEQQACGRQQRARVGPPYGAPDHARRDVEVEARHVAARPDHTGELRHGRVWIVDVAQQVGEADGIEGLRLVRKRFGSSRLEPKRFL